MTGYEPYVNAECPRCGNTEGNIDHGPYEPHPLDAEAGGAPDPAVHLMTCGGCHKVFDEMPADLAWAQWEPAARWYADACPHPDCHPGDNPASLPGNLGEKRGRILGEYRCPRGHVWVTWWANGRRVENHWAIERSLIDPAAAASEAVEALRLLEEAFGRTGEAA